MTRDNAIQKVRQLFDEHGFKYKWSDADKTFTGTFASKSFPGRVTRFNISFWSTDAVNVTSWDVNANGRLEKMSLLLAAINASLIKGNFDLDVLTGEVKYRNAISFTSLEHCNWEELYNFVVLPTKMFFENANLFDRIVSPGGGLT